MYTKEYILLNKEDSTVACVFSVLQMYITWEIVPLK